MPARSTTEIAEDLYAALGRFEKDRIREILHPEFQGQIAAGMPLELGGSYHGPDTMIEQVWSRAAEAFIVTAEPDRYLPCGSDQLVVFGRYRGKAHSTGRKFQAAFAHILAFRDDRVSELIQVTDTAIWAAALAED